MVPQWKAERVFVGNEPNRFKLFPLRRVWGAPAIADFGTDADAATLAAAAPDLLEAAREAADLVKLARQYFPKSIRHANAFKLELTAAALSKAILKATGTDAGNGEG